MAELMSIRQIREKYPGEWLLVGYEELDDELNIIRGEVLAHSPHKEEVYRHLLSLKGRKVSIEYAGEMPEDLVVVL